MKKTILLLIALFCWLNGFAQNLSELVRQNENAVFLIITYDKYGNPLGQGSGFFISADGIGITNVHVLENAAKAEIKTNDNHSYTIDKILDWDSNFDLAKFKISNPSGGTLTFVSFADAAPMKGEDIFVISNPQGLESTVSNGIVSSVREMEGYGHTIQITAPISAGSSGAPVFNMKGKVIGVAAFTVLDGQNLNFAIDIGQVKKLTAQKNITLAEASPQYNYEDFMMKGDVACTTSDWDKAIFYYTKEIERNPKDADAYLFRGIAKDQMKNFLGAIQDYSSAISIYPDYWLAYFYRGYDKSELGNYSDAIQDYSSAISIKPDFASAYNNRGAAKYDLEDYREAISDYTQAISMNPNLAEAYIGRGIVKYKLEDYREAISDYTQAISINPNLAEAYYNRGNVKEKLENYSGAIQDYSSAISINPDFADAYFSRGNGKYMIKDIYGACKDLRKAADLGNMNAYVLIQIYCK